jgi:hypothetical protein
MRLEFGLREDVEQEMWFIASSSDGFDWADLTGGPATPAGALLHAWGRSSEGFLLVGTDERGQMLVWEWH